MTSAIPVLNILLKLSIYCDDLHLLKMHFPQYKYMTFMYSYHNTILCCLIVKVFTNIVLCREIFFCVLLQAEKILSFYEESNL